MGDTVKIICEKCGSQQNIDAKLNKAFCQYCGKEIEVRKVDKTNKVAIMLKYIHIIIGILLGFYFSFKVKSILKYNAIVPTVIIVTIFCAFWILIMVFLKKKIIELFSAENKLMYIKNDFVFIKKHWKKILPVLFIICGFTIFLMYKDYDNKRIKDIEIPISNLECVNANYNEIYNKFETAGFFTISGEAINDLLEGEMSDNEKIISVSIDGNENFNKGDLSSSDKTVIIRYHSPNKKNPPISSISISDKNYEDVEKQFKEIGFLNVEVEPIEDLITGWIIKDGQIEEVTISDSSSFSTDDLFFADALVKIKYHTFSSNEVTDLENNSKDENEKVELEKKSIEENFDKEEQNKEEQIKIEEIDYELACRAAIVAITNGYAMDVFSDDGNTYDTSKFHSFSDTTGYYMIIKDIGNWTKKKTDNWHVDGLALQAVGYKIVTDAQLDVEFDGENYIISNIVGTFGNNDLSELCLGESSSTYLVVPKKMVEEDRDVISDNSSDFLDEFEARRIIEKYGKKQYGNFECHWFSNYINAEQNYEGEWFIKVGVTVKNIYGQKIDGILEATVGGTKNEPVIKQFDISR